MARTFKEFLDVFIHGQTLEQQRELDRVKFRDRLTGRGRIKETPLLPAPGNVITDRIADRPISDITPEEMAEIDKVGMDVPFRGIKAPPGRGLEPRFSPTGRQPLIPEFPITPDIADTTRVPEVLPDTGKAPGGFDWDRFIEVMGTVGAGLAPRGPFAKAGLAAAGLVREKRERGVKAAATAEDVRRFEIETRLKEVDDAREQAKLDWQKDPTNPRSLENLIKLENEKNRLRIELEAAKQPAKAAKAKKVEDRRGKVATQQRKNRIRTARSKAMATMRRHGISEDIPQLTKFDAEQLKRIRDIIREMDITGDETTDEIIQRAVDILEDEAPLTVEKLAGLVTAEELLGPDEETTDFITDEELLRR